jgi:L-ribulose-5-phosphate 4-epimerase
MSLQLAPNLGPIEPELLAKHFRRKHGPGAYYGQGAPTAAGAKGAAVR